MCKNTHKISHQPVSRIVSQWSLRKLVLIHKSYKNNSKQIHEVDNLSILRSWLQFSIRTRVSEHFSADPVHLKSENLLQLWNIASRDYFNFVFVQFLALWLHWCYKVPHDKLILYTLKIAHSSKAYLVDGIWVEYNIFHSINLMQ